LVVPDRTRKYVRIKDIIDSGAKPLIDILVEDLTEAQALRLEAELIAAFGTEDTGGLLTNSVVPAGLGGKKRRNIIVPQGAVERAQLGLEFMKNAILELAKANSDGITTPMPLASWAFEATIAVGRRTTCHIACWVCYCGKAK
jgi:hypothetical protein